jgi:hypothetical protein
MEISTFTYKTAHLLKTSSNGTQNESEATFKWQKSLMAALSSFYDFFYIHT